MFFIKMYITSVSIFGQSDEPDVNVTKRNVAQFFAKCWNPFFEMCPVTNPAKASFSKIWQLQKTPFGQKQIEYFGTFWHFSVFQYLSCEGENNFEKFEKMFCKN